jgi:hypothetical protein
MVTPAAKLCQALFQSRLTILQNNILESEGPGFHGKSRKIFDSAKIYFWDIVAVIQRNSEFCPNSHYAILMSCHLLHML